MGVDTDNDGQTFASGTLGNWQPYLYLGEIPANLMIRAEVDPAGPVGGVVMPANTLAVFAPYLALFGLVVTVAVVVAAPWKKPEN